MSHIIETRPYILVNLSVNLQSLDPPQNRGNAYAIYIYIYIYIYWVRARFQKFHGFPISTSSNMKYRLREL
jgi:hypothetical protein